MEMGQTALRLPRFVPPNKGGLSPGRAAPQPPGLFLSPASINTALPKTNRRIEGDVGDRALPYPQRSAGMSSVRKVMYTGLIKMFGFDRGSASQVLRLEMQEAFPSPQHR